VVVESPPGRFEDWAPGDSLAVFSWNMAVGGGNLEAFLAEEVGLSCRGEETVASGRYPHFVLLLQEAFRRSDALPPLDDPGLAARKSRHDPHPEGDADVLELAARCGLAAIYVPSGRNGADTPGEERIDKGNAILSTLPMSGFLAIENPFETERKVSVAASVSIPGAMPLRLVSAHLEVTSTFRRTILTGNQTRYRQAAGLIEALQRQEGWEGRAPAVLVGGDFNTWSGGESALKMLRGAFPDSPPWDGRSTMGLFPTDHIFFRQGSHGGEGASVILVDGSYSRVQLKYSSDHHGRFVWLRIQDGASGGMQEPGPGSNPR